LTCADSSSPSSGGVIPVAWSPGASNGGGGGTSTGAARPPRPSPVRGGGQSRQALLDVVAQLQAEVAVAESRRHEAEQAAAEAQQTVQDLRRQVDKVQALAASKEALIAELSTKLQASSAASAELDGELAAARMAVEGEQADLDRTRRQLGATDALVQRLMAAIAERGRTSPSKRLGGGASVAVTATAEAMHSSATTSSCGSPQSSIGSVAPRAR
jgi:myosin heavy subunit